MREKQLRYVLSVLRKTAKKRKLHSITSEVPLSKILYFLSFQKCIHACSS